MNANSDYLFFDEEEPQEVVEQTPPTGMPWKILIIDDDHEVHAVTKLVLSNFEWNGRKLQFFDAYSAKEAIHILEIEDDIAVALVDVVMETDDAGLTLIEKIRNTLNNHTVRLVLRTGQPGQAPERHVIREYDVSDYKNKTELSDVKLDTLLCSSLRAYRDITNLERNQRGLETVIKASSNIFTTQSREEFAITTLNQLTTLLQRTQLSSKPFKSSGIALFRDNSGIAVLTTQGDLIRLQGINSEAELPSEIKELLQAALNERRNQYRENDLLVYIENKHKACMMFYISGFKQFEQLNIDLISLLTANAGVCFENSELRQELEDGQREIVYLLGEAIETRSKESGKHIRRVAEITALLASEFGYSDEDVNKIKSASPLHDIGKVGIPETILAKQDPLDPNELETIKSHAEIGYDMMKDSEQDLLCFASIIANQHHEKWDGTGYPHGLKGEEIHILGRISSVADVFDALAHNQCYRNAWPIDKVFNYISEHSGSHFDPQVVDQFLKNREKILAIHSSLLDETNDN